MPQIDRVVVISLARRPERLAAFRERLAAAWPGQAIEVVRAVDGQASPPPDWWGTSPGAWGCYRSHQRILEDALHDGVESVLIFEDDATFAADFASRLDAYWQALPADAGQIYLGGQHLKPPRPVNDQVVRGMNVNRTHAYAVRRREAIRRLYRWLHAGTHWRPGRDHVDHHYGRQHPSGVSAYAPRVWLCGQAAGESDIARRLSPERWWSAPPQPQAPSACADART